MADVDLLVLGDCNPDLIVRSADLEPLFGQAEQLVDDARLTVGGSGAILACGASRLGLRTAVVAVVGDDLFGRFVLGALSDRGVDVAGCTVDHGTATGLGVHLVRQNDRAILTALGTIASLTGDLVEDGRLRAARHVHVSSYFLQTALAPDVPRIFAEARASGATTSVDTNWDPVGTWDSGIWDVLAVADCLFVNAEEAARITGSPDLEESLPLFTRACRRVIVKLGAEGALAAVDGELIQAPALPVRIVDAVGAGDSFDAGYLAGWLGGQPPHQALMLACACGSLSTRAAGGVDAQPTIEEALEALRSTS